MCLCRVAGSRVASSSRLGCQTSNYLVCVLLQPALLVYIWVEVCGLRWLRPCGTADQEPVFFACIGSYFVTFSREVWLGLVVALICLGFLVVYV